MAHPSRNCGSMYSHSRGDLGAWFFRWIIALFAIGVTVAALIDHVDKAPRL